MEEIKNNSTIHYSKPWFEDEKDTMQPFPTGKYDEYNEKSYVGVIH
tara:strand:- start:941 stop:1078 length:138 start_codon:yes stop_codon:yes gene_type:complete